MFEPHRHPTIGWVLTGAGFVMIGASFVLNVVFDIPGVVLHNVLQLGGLAVAVIGTLFLGGFFVRDDGDGD